jgi:hypothetical protein
MLTDFVVKEKRKSGMIIALSTDSNNKEASPALRANSEEG